MVALSVSDNELMRSAQLEPTSTVEFSHFFFGEN